jgi:hypothetical protein
MRIPFPLACVLGLVAGCGSEPGGGPERTSGGPPAASPGRTATEVSARSGAALVHRTVRPSATDPAIGSPDDDHHVYLAASGPRAGKLLVFLPGTGGRPANATLFLQEAARAGYHAVGLAYPNQDSANQVCGDDLGCYEKMRRECFDGAGGGAIVGVTPANAIKHRLVALLSWLQQRHPGEGWGAFLAGDDLQYGALALAGLSQGGGHAAYIAKVHRVARVLMFSSVCDADRGEPPTPATWVSGAHATPVERYYGFDHTSDPFAAKIAVTWPALGLDELGPRTSVDRAAPPYGGSHQLVTSVQVPGRKQAHACVVGDAATPMNDDGPRFREVWRYMLGP